jgi:tetratricopeptide (TPR) repeat protein
MATPLPQTLKVFISYSHDSPEHADRVLELADRLRADGIDAVLDQYEVSPPEGWPRWMDRWIRDSQFVLMVCTPTYYHRVMGEEEPGVGLGVRWEGNLIYQHIYIAGTLNAKFIPVQFAEGEVSQIPTPLQGVTNYRIDTEQGYEKLYRRLTDQPHALKAELGPLRALPSRERRPDFFGALWNVPYRRNAFFTGRDRVLQDLHDRFTRGDTALTTQAISGLGGLGKTQTAVEYAFRYGSEYDAVLWARADTEVALNASFGEIAGLLDLPAANDSEQRRAVEAVRRWLETHDRWLLIVDNADRPELVEPFLPRHPKGHTLLTSREQVFDQLDIPEPVGLEVLTAAEASQFLLIRAGHGASDAGEQAAAAELAAELGSLPLALEQAGAYIRANKPRFQDYLKSFRARRLELLKRRAPVTGDYPESVATTWSLNFRAVEEESDASADLLRLSAFLSPDRIPLELLTLGVGELGPILAAALAHLHEDPLALPETLAPPTRYSLIRRDVDSDTFSIHRLVQAVLQDGMDAGSRRLWAERAVRAVSAAFPSPEYRNWSACARLLGQAESSAELVKQWTLDFPEATGLLDDAGTCLRDRGQYLASYRLYRRAWWIRRRPRKLRDSRLAASLYYLGTLLRLQGRYRAGERLLRGTLEIWEGGSSPEDLNIARCLNSLANLLYDERRYSDAEPLFRRALALREAARGPEHPEVATILSNLALLLCDVDRREEAALLYRRALAIRERVLEPQHPDVAQTLNNLARLYYREREYSKAEPLYVRAIHSQELSLGDKHPNVGISLHNLAELYRKLHRSADAEPLYARALGIWEEALGPRHRYIAEASEGLGRLRLAQHRFEEAYTQFDRSVAILERTLGREAVRTRRARRLLMVAEGRLTRGTS